MADKRISQLIERVDIANNDVLPIVASGATTTNKVTISTIQDWMQENLDVGVTSVGITIGSTGTDVSVTGSPITTSGNITINIPDASASARGLVTTGSQVFGGVKTFANGLSLPAVGGSNQTTRIVNIGSLHEGTASLNQIGFNSGNNIYFGKGLNNGGVIQWNNAAVRYYTLPDADGTIALTSQLDGYVTLNTAQTITAQKTFTTSGSSDTMIISHGSGSGIALDVIKAGNGQAIRVQKTSGTGDAVTITGGLLSATGISVNTPSSGIGVLLNGRTSDNFSSIRFGANTGAGQYNAISADASSFDISSLGNTPITFSTNTQGGAGTRMTISGTGAVTLTGALNGTSANFSDTLIASRSSAGASVIVTNTGVNAQLQFANNTSQSTIGIANLGSGAAANTFYINTSLGAIGSGITMNDSGAVTLSNTLTIAGTSTSSIVVGNADGTSKFYQLSYNNSQANSRSWRLSNDVSVFGDFAISQSTTQTGSTYSPVLSFAPTGAATFSGNTVAANGSVNIEAADPALRFRVTGGTANSRIYEWRAVAAGGANDIMQLRLWNDAQSSASTLMSITPTGAATFSSSVTATSGVFTDGSQGLIVRPYTFAGVGTGAIYLFGVTPTNQNFLFAASSTGTTINTFTGGSINFSINGQAPSMIVNTSGNVGIGTASPDIYGFGASGRYLTLQNTAGFSLMQVISNGTDGSGISFGNATIRRASIDAVNGSDLTFNTNASNSGSTMTERMRLTSDGNIRYTSNNAANASFDLNYRFSTPDSARIRFSTTSVFNQNEPGEISFWTRANDSQGGGSISERMRITSGGTVLIGTENNSPSAGHGLKNYADGRIYCVSSATSNASESYGMYSTGASNYRFYVGWGGTIFATNTTISGISDARLKENVRDLDAGLDKIMALKPRVFDWKEGKGKDIKNDRGFIAQEFEEVFPDLIDEYKQEVEEGEEPYKSVRADLIPVLVKAIQEQQEQIKSLTEQVEALKSQING